MVITGPGLSASATVSVRWRPGVREGWIGLSGCGTLVVVCVWVDQGGGAGGESELRLKVVVNPPQVSELKFQGK